MSQNGCVIEPDPRFSAQKNPEVRPDMEKWCQPRSLQPMKPGLQNVQGKTAQKPGGVPFVVDDFDRC